MFPVSQEFSSEISPPSLTPGSNRDLYVDSTLHELPLYHFQVKTSCTGVELATVFEKYPLLPGAILVEDARYAGMISRRQLLEFLIRPYGKELFFQQPLSILYSYLRTRILQLRYDTPILTAMQLVLRRSPELLPEPVVVQTAPETYKLLDVQELNIAAWLIRGIETQVRYERSQAQMIQNDKMASLGRLVDGVAHEILDPLNFIWGNLTYVSNYSKDLMRLIAAYEKEFGDASQDVFNLKQEIEYDYLEQDLSRALASISTGAERLKKLVTGLQTFCHIDEICPKPADLHACLDSIILLIKTRIKGEIEIVTHYGYLPPINCFIGQLTQVFMNILSLSIDSLLNEAVRQQMNIETKNIPPKPQITITTEVVSARKQDAVHSRRWVSICIADNGSGMSQELQKQLAESFSLEKRADRETSLALSYQIITARHGGKLNLRSELGVGTEFEILLPLV
jgi:signal transduction histidine kinase